MSAIRRLVTAACAALLVGVGIMFLAGSLFAPFGAAAGEGPGMALVGAILAAAGVARFVTLGRPRRRRRLELAASAVAFLAALWAFGFRAERVDLLGIFAIAACLALLVDALVGPARIGEATEDAT